MSLRETYTSPPWNSWAHTRSEWNPRGRPFHSCFERWLLERPWQVHMLPLGSIHPHDLLFLSLGVLPSRYSPPFVSRVLGRVFSDGPKHAPAGGSTHKHSQTSCWTSSDRHVHVHACATCIRASEAVLAERRRRRRCRNDSGAWKEVRKRTEGMADGS